MKRAVGRGLCAAAFTGIALLAAFAPAAAQDSCTNCLERPVVTSTPASGSTYYPGETIVVQVRPRSAPWVSITSADSPTLVLNVGGSDKTLSGNLQSQRFSYTYYDLGEVRTAYRDSNVLEFRYTVQKGDRDTDGVSVAANALGGGNIGANVGGSQHGGGTWRPNLSKNHSAMSAQSGHKVDTPAPSWTGVTAPDIIFYAGGSVSYRLPQVANAAAAHNVSYSVTSARPLPTGYTLNASTGTITGSYGSASARQSYTLRATDGFSRTADLTFHLQVSADAGIESISITSNPGADNTYGKVAPFGTNDTITVRVDFTHRLTTVLGARVCLNIEIGSNTRRECNPSSYTSDSSRWDKLDFSYAVQAGDWDGDGISFPTNPMGAGKDGGLRFRITGVGTDNRVNRNFASIPDDANHKVRGQQTVPSFGSTASPSYSWVKGNAVSQALPAATGGDGGVTYSIEESLPAGLSFAAATRTISGTPTAAQAAANYTLAATDADGDKATLRFSIEIEEITVSISSPSVTEGDSDSTDLTFTATLSTTSTQQVTVDYADAGTGTATSGTDYTAITGGTLTFTAGTTSQTFDVSVTGDTTDEVDETILVTLSNASGATISTATGTGTITDDDDPPTVSVAAASVTEGDSGSKNLTFTATLSAASGKQVTVNWAEGTGGTATSGTDYTAITGGTLTFAAGTTSQTFNVSVTGDTDDEPDETVVVTLSGAMNATLSSTAASATGTIIDDDRPTVTLSLSSSSISENGGVATVTATLDEAATVATTVTVAAAAGTDTDSSDFNLSSANTLTIAAGDTTSTGTVTITAVDNALDEPNKSVTVSGTVSHNGVAPPTAKTLTITDDDPAPMLSIDSPSVTEGDSGSKNLTFTATLSAASGRQVTVDYADAGTGTATSGTDYTAITGGTLTFAAGTTSQTFNVAVTGDALDEADETVKVRLKDPVNAAVSTTAGTGTGTITDNDATPTLSISSPSVSEGDSGSTSLTYTVTLSAASGRQVTVQYADAGTGTATSGTDYTAITGGTLTFAAGTTSQTFSVLVTGDTVNESNETILVSLSAPTNATVSSTAGTGTGTITDDDGAPSTITLTVDDDDVGEGDGATTITVTATVDGTTRFAEAKTVSVSVAGSGTAGAVDFAAVSNFNISIAAGAASGTGTFTLTPTDDSDDETDETITVSGTSTGLTVNPATISLTDDDGTPTSITLTVNDNSVGEGDGATTITVTATLDGSTTLGSATTVRVNVAGSGTATAVDFDTVSAFDITIAAGDASGTANFTLTPTNDVVDETDETITVRGTSTGLTVNSATISLTDNDAAPTAITLTVSDSSVGEGDGATSITVTATVDGTTRFAEAKTVRVSVAGSGTAGAVDFAAVSSFDIEIAAEAASDTAGFTLTPTDDAVDETNETITVRGTSSGLTVNAATITLTDDDGAPTSITLTVDDSSVGEGDGAATITVTATVDGTMRFAAATTVTVSVAGSGTATAVDFAAVSSFDITIPAGAASKTGSFTLTPTNDAVDETDETVTVSGSSGSLTVNSATITLTDNDAAPTAITLTVSHDSVSEGDGATTITVTATVDGTMRFAEDTTVSVLVRSDSGTMNAVDFASVPGFDIEIAAGDASGTETFTLTPTNDAVDENDETITVYGASGSLTVSSATITLTDDDATPTAITLTVSDNSVAEDDGATTITVTATLDGATRFATATTVTVSVAGTGTATAVDFAAVTDFDIEIPAADASASETFTLTPTNDAFDETNETITVSGTSGSLTVNSATITLTDDDDAPTAITLTVDDNSVAEDDGATSITVTATVDGASRFTEATTVTVSVGGSGTASAVDFAAVTDFDITIAAEAASKTGTFTLTPTNDVVDETNETITVSGESGSLTVNSATITLTDDDDAPTAITLTVNDNSVAEGDGATSITVTATVDGTTRFAAATTVTVSVGGSGTASAVDFAAVTDFDITIAAEAQSKTGTFTLTPTNDVVDETDETVTVSGESGSLTVNSATITLTDDDAAPTAITLTVNDNSVAEDDGATTITVTATVDGTTRFAAATTVTVSVAGSGTATAVDFAAVSSFDITIAADAASGASDFTLTPTDDTADETDETITVSGASGSLTVNSATISLTDDDATPTLSISSPSVSEGDSGSTSLTYTVTLSAASGRQVTVQYADAGTGTATSGTDYTAITGGTLTFAAGTTSQTFDVSVTGDVLAESNETVVVTWSNAANATISSRSGVVATALRVDGTITDDDAAPTSITLTVDDNSVAEDDGATTIRVKATVNGGTRFATATTVSVSVAGSGTATAVDFAAVSSFDIEIAAGAQSEDETFTLTPTNDVVDETNETVTVSGSSGTLTVNSATISLTDDDAAPTAITLTVNDNSVAEDDGATTITVTATVDGTTRFATATTVTVSVGDSGTASAVDFAAVSDFDITIAAEAASKTGTFTLTPTNDVLDETDETVTVSGSSGSLTVNSATITLTDDDAAPTAITLTVNDNSVGEGDGATTITVTATVDGTTRFAAATTVEVSVAGSGTATAVDFAAVTDFDIEIAAGEASKTGTFTLTPTDDAVDETDETVTVSGSSGSLTVNSATITLTDDDDAPTSITLTVDDDGVGEGDGATTITVTATVDGTTRFAAATTVEVSVAGSGTASAVDFAAVSPFNIEIAAEAQSKAGTFTLTPTDDSVDETDETITVSGTSTGLTVNSDTISLTDDDGAPTSITLSVNDNSVAENDGATTITVKATVNGTTQFAEATTVSVSVAGSGTATAVDFAAVSDFNIEIAAGAMSEDETFTLTPTNDAADETDETITVSGTSAGLIVNSATISLTDDDPEPTVSINDLSVTEGDSGSANLTFTVSLSAASGKQVTVQYADAGTGTATSGTDYTAITSAELTFAAGETSKTFDVSVTGDTTDEPNETVAVSLSSAANATVSTSAGTGTGTITDDDDPPELSIDSPRVAEGDDASANLTFTVSLSAASGKQVTVQYADAGTGTATSGTDYTAITGGTLTFAAGTIEQSFDVSVTGDTDEEPSETVEVSLSSATNATVSPTAGTGTGTILDDDAPVFPEIEDLELSIDSPRVTEGDRRSRELTFTVTLNAASGDDVTVRYADAGTGTATSGTDYRAIRGGTVTLVAGATTEEFTVRVIGDTADEPDETVVVALSDPVNAVVSSTAGTGTGTILDNDDAPTLSIDSPRVTEGDSGSATLTFTVRLSVASGREVTVQYAVTGTGTATAGTDYTVLGEGTLTFAAGTIEQSFDVTVPGDTENEPDETVVVSLSSPTNAVVSSTAGSGTGTIIDDDGPEDPGMEDEDKDLELAIDSPRVTEGDSGSRDLTFTVRLSAASEREVTVRYADAGTGTATSGTDYEALGGGTLTFAAGTTTREVTVRVTGDTLDEEDETVLVSLSDAVNAAITTGTGTGTITDDDAAPALSIDSPRVTEGDSGSRDLTFTVTLSAASGREVTVRYADAGTGTATSGTDYTALGGGTLTFAAGTIEQSFGVSVTGDTMDEPDETVAVSLSEAVNAVIATGTGTGTIINDDINLTPSFGSATIPDQSWTQNEAVATFRLPEATGGNGTLRYALTPALPAGIVRNPATHEISGTPAAPAAAVAYTWEATDADGDTAALRFAIVVESSMARELRQAPMQQALAGFGRTVASEAVGAISARFEPLSACESDASLGVQTLALQTPSGAGALANMQEQRWGDPFARVRYRRNLGDLTSAAGNGVGMPGAGGFNSQWQGSEQEVRLQDVLAQSYFDLGLGGGERSVDCRPRGVWGRGALSNFSSQAGGGMQGEVFSGYVGADMSLGSRVLLGVAVSHSAGEMDYTLQRGAHQGARGAVDTELISVLPYAHWTVHEDLGLWGMLGRGWGEAELSDALGRTNADLEMNMAALGARHALSRAGNLELALKADAFVTRMESGEGVDLDRVGADTRRVRLLLEARTGLASTASSELDLNLEAGGRWDGGDAETGLGMEVGGGLSYRHAGLGLGIDARGHYLLAHREDDFKDWGASLALSLDPGTPDEGLAVSFVPSWGAPNSQAEMLWRGQQQLSALTRHGAGRLADQGGGRRPSEMELELGYGFATRDKEEGRVRLFSTLSDSGFTGRRYRMGSDINLPDKYAVSLELERQEYVLDTSYGFLIQFTTPTW